MRRLPIFLTILLIGLIAGILIATRFDFSPRSNAGQKQQTESVPEAQVPAAVAFAGNILDEDAFVKVAEAVGPAVVSISTERTEKIGPITRRMRPFSEFREDEFFDRFFRDFFQDMPEREFKQRGLGSGLIIDAKGYILTNEHVVGDADKITIALSDGREFKGRVAGKDYRSDLAVVKIDAANIPVVKLGDSDTVKIGQWAIAIGNPFAFMVHSPQPTVTVGVISATNRSISGSIASNRDYSNLIQTDAAINPGNSGGPLVNIKGEVIGINVAIFSTSGGYQGVGFAIPINTAKNIIAQLIEGKEVVYGWLGVNIQEIDQKLADYFKLPDKKGVIVVKVFPQSPAEKAGMKKGDVIKAFDDKEISSLSDLMIKVSHTPVDKKVKIKIMRDKKEQTLEALIEKRPQDKDVEQLKETAADKEAWRGIQVIDITSDITQRYNLEQTEGVVVVNVEPNSPADEAGIEPGDVIETINNFHIKNIQDYKEITNKITADALALTNKGYVVIKAQQ